MSDPFVGEIRMFAGNYAPVDWALCDGHLLSIQDYGALFSLIGTTYGGDGISTFAVPDLRGRIPVHVSGTHPLGAMGGSESVTLVTSQLPNHTHVPQVNANQGNSLDPSGAFWAGNSFQNFSTDVQGLVNMSPQAIDAAGGSQPHENMMPSLTISFIISLQGVYPPRN